MYVPAKIKFKHASIFTEDYLHKFVFNHNSIHAVNIFFLKPAS